MVLEHDSEIFKWKVFMVSGMEYVGTMQKYAFDWLLISGNTNHTEAILWAHFIVFEEGVNTKLKIRMLMPSSWAINSAQYVIVVLLNESPIHLCLANKEKKTTARRGKQTYVALISMYIYLSFFCMEWQYYTHVATV